MTAGKAKGAARDYQVLCRDVLQRRFGGAPYSGDGIDVAFDAAGTTWTVDVALSGGGQHEGGIVLAECRATSSPQKQGDVAHFAFVAEKIRAATGKPVAAFFMTQTEPQRGALKVEPDVALSIAVVNGTDLDNVRTAFLEYDREREQRIHHHLMFLSAGTFQLQAPSVSLVVRNADGTIREQR